MRTKETAIKSSAGLARTIKWTKSCSADHAPPDHSWYVADAAATATDVMGFLEGKFDQARTDAGEGYATRLLRMA